MILPYKQDKPLRVIHFQYNVVVAVQYQRLGQQRHTCHTVLQLDHLQLCPSRLVRLQLDDIQLDHQKMFVNRKQGCMSRTSVGGPSPPLHLVLGRGLMHP